MNESELSKLVRVMAHPGQRNAVSPDKTMYAMRGQDFTQQTLHHEQADMRVVLTYLESLADELEDTANLMAPHPRLRMSMHLLQGHLDGKPVTPTSLIDAKVGCSNRIQASRCRL